MLSRSYKDAAGRSSSELQTQLKTVVGQAKIDVAPVSADDVIMVGDHLVANLHATFHPAGGRSSHERFELVMEKSGGGWAISSVRSV